MFSRISPKGKGKKSKKKKARKKGTVSIEKQVARRTLEKLCEQYRIDLGKVKPSEIDFGWFAARKIPWEDAQKIIKCLEELKK